VKQLPQADMQQAARDMHVIEGLTSLHAPPLFLTQQRHRHHDMPLCGVV
jgi:hypothetical protein